ncbi:unannotated protein [freshwater metagenome]|uniref:Unannotated protein n=1 Tax=freshwater metagenome TaxID=449393 RepID=A0A6J7TC61_9ZZZZ
MYGHCATSVIIPPDVEIYLGARITGSWPEQTPGLGMGPNTSAGEYFIEVRTIGGDANLQPEQYLPIEPNSAEGWRRINVRVS